MRNATVGLMSVNLHVVRVRPHPITSSNNTEQKCSLKVSDSFNSSSNFSFFNAIAYRITPPGKGPIKIKLNQYLNNSKNKN